MSFSIGPRLLVLARHGQSEGNQQNSFTGWRDLPLTAQGEGEARLAGERLREMGVAFGAAFTSKLSRASASSSLMLETMNQGRTTVESDVAGNESAYGDLTRPQQRSGPPAVRHRSGPCLAPLPRRGAPPNGEQSHVHRCTGVVEQSVLFSYQKRAFCNCFNLLGFASRERKKWALCCRDGDQSEILGRDIRCRIERGRRARPVRTGSRPPPRRNLDDALYVRPDLAQPRISTRSRRSSSSRRRADLCGPIAGRTCPACRPCGKSRRRPAAQRQPS